MAKRPTPEDEDLFLRAMRDIKPRRPRDARDLKTAPPAPVGTELRPASPPEPTAAATAPRAGLDRRSRRRIAQGRTRIDARLDLHGLTQDAAHARLRSFIQQSRRAGHACVLVITGKGASRRDDEASGMRDRERGLLRRNVPRWLAGMGDAVWAIEPAAKAHGGDGALYVMLRRER